MTEMGICISCCMLSDKTNIIIFKYLLLLFICPVILLGLRVGTALNPLVIPTYGIF